MIAHMRPLQDRPNQATWDAIEVSDFPATYLPSECLPDIKEVKDMANRRFEMYQYRRVLTRMRLGESDRAIARSALMGREKASALRDSCTS